MRAVQARRSVHLLASQRTHGWCGCTHVTRPQLTGRAVQARHVRTSCISRVAQERRPVASDGLPEHVPPSPVILSGIQPTGVPHLGNYIGALRNWVQMQGEPGHSDQQLFAVMDMHSITVPQDPETLRTNIREAATSLLAIGLDPTRCTLFQQSRVSQHAELAWILGCSATTAQLEHMTQWKVKKRGKAAGAANLGLLAYPVLMAADVLVYRATHVPVGDDQRQHMELARDLATTFNRHVSRSVFPIPNVVVPPVAARVMSLRDPEKKMSKSDRSPASRIVLTDNVDTVRAKVRKAVTDSIGTITYDPQERPGVSNLIDMYSAVTGRTTAEAVSTFAGCDTLEFKEGVAVAISEHLSPIQTEYTRLQRDPQYVTHVLDAGAQRATVLAEATMVNVRDAVGLTW
eukprot:m.95213 g.95213  ORF g.95213 m.95213 type:complete len:403 (+) comp10093_c0_seq2:79-1287(+)